MNRALEPLSPIERFSNRVADYARYRPHYPPALFATLTAEAGLTAAAIVADIGSGTGLSALPFLENGNRVLGVEPNADMRRAGEQSLAAWPGFTSVDGSAEATTLPDASVDFVVAGQAFHWFDVARTRAELARIVRPPGRVALFWNTRATEASPFMRAYEGLIERRSRDYAQVRHDRLTAEDVLALFEARRCTFRTFPNAQFLDLEGLIGRTFSSSYMPAADDPAAPAVLEELRALFVRFGRDGQVQYDYLTELYYGFVAARRPG